MAHLLVLAQPVHSNFFMFSPRIMAQSAFGASLLSPATAHPGTVFLLATNRVGTPRLAAALRVTDRQPLAPE
jgi:hypothetical protein